MINSGSDALGVCEEFWDAGTGLDYCGTERVGLRQLGTQLRDLSNYCGAVLGLALTVLGCGFD